uniref:NYN domain-containing protein n=1 Tax=Brassica oleracea var. oleracea TaxID=109376 RepID=A0A0D3BIU6_BRAOL
MTRVTWSTVRLRMDLGMYDANVEELKDAADNAIINEIKAFWRRHENRPPCNVMVMSGDKIFLNTLKRLNIKGYMTLAAFRPKTSNENKINAQVEDSWVLRQLLCLPWQKHPSEKIIIFFTTCNSVKYHAAMFRVLDVPCSEIHGKLVLEKNLHTFSEFKNLRFLPRQMLRVEVEKEDLNIERKQI